MKKKQRQLPPFKVVQPIVLFVAGLSAFGWQVFFETTDRPYLLAVIAGMIGLPFVIFADKARNAGGEKDEPEDPF